MLINEKFIILYFYWGIREKLKKYEKRQTFELNLYLLLFFFNYFVKHHKKS